MSKVIIFGNGQTAEIVYYYFKNDSPHEVVAFTADSEFIQSKEYLGLPLIPFESIEKTFPPNIFDMFVALSYKNLNRLRASKYEEAKKKNYKLINYICSKAGIIGDLKMGDNCFILQNQSIQPFVKIGSNVWIWSSTLIGHHAQIGDHCWITSEASIGGNVKIGPYCFLSMNATIGHMVTVGRESFIGANTLITKNTKDKSVYIAKDTEPYLLDSDKFLMITKMK